MPRYFLHVRDPKALTYTPVIAVFAATALLAVAASYAAFGEALTIQTGEWFIAFSMVVLAMLKLRDLDGLADRPWDRLFGMPSLERPAQDPTNVSNSTRPEHLAGKAGGRKPNRHTPRRGPCSTRSAPRRCAP